MIAPSLCIPRVFDTSVTKQYVYRVFDKYNWGPISRVDLVVKNKNTRIFVHFKYWIENEKNATLKDHLLQGNAVNIIHSHPWFWKCSASKIPKP